MSTPHPFFHPVLRLFCVVMIIFIAIISQSGPKEEYIRSAEATVNSVEYKQESKTKGPLTEYQYLNISYEADGRSHTVTQRNEMPSIEYKVAEKFPVFYDARSPRDLIDPAVLPMKEGIGGGKLHGSDLVAIVFMLPFVLILLGSFVYLFEENKKNSRKRFY